MKDSYIKVQLYSLNTLKVLIFSSIPLNNNVRYTLFIDNNPPVELKVKKSSSFNYLSMIELALPSTYQFGHQYLLNVSGYPTQVVEANSAIYFSEFDKLFNYNGNDLGAIYSKKETAFALWAPLAIGVTLKLEDNKGGFVYYPMTRTSKGVYRVTIIGDLLNKKYSYLVNNDGVVRESLDPYGKGVSFNSAYSAIVDIEAIKAIKTYIPKTPFKSYSDAIIYETNIRDMTEDNSKTTNIVNKGKYLGFIEKDRKTKGKHSAALDYLVELGVTHIQLNPVIDFGSIKDDDKKHYNWGYDPISNFALEGNYSLKPEVPMERLIEFKTLVNELHKVNLRVVLDVVYNHVYRYLETCYEKVLPNYFFMRDGEGNIANASGCGNDFACYRYMARKCIIDSCTYFVDVFDIDGFRFDLMGLLDIKTMNDIVKYCSDIKQSLIFYGEGWNMGYLPFEMKACIDNASKMPRYAFFNDMYRDLVKGSTFDLAKGGYASGDISYTSGMMFALLGCSVDKTYVHRFSSPNQSINYIECHDNNTLMDKLLISNHWEEPERLLRRINFANSVVMFSLGVPFFHMGQEIGQSKKGNPNTYNVPYINAFDYRIMDERYNMVAYFALLCKMRKKLQLAKYDNVALIKSHISVEQRDALLYFNIIDDTIDPRYSGYSIVFNPSNNNVYDTIKGNHDVIFAYGNKSRNIVEYTFPYLSTTILARKR